LHWLAQSVSQLVSLSDFVVYIRADRLSRAIQVHYAPNNKGPGYLRLSLRRRLRLGLSGIVVEAPPFPANVWFINKWHLNCAISIAKQSEISARSHWHRLGMGFVIPQPVGDVAALGLGLAGLMCHVTCRTNRGAIGPLWRTNACI